MLIESLADAGSATVADGHLSITLAPRSASIWITAPGTDLEAPPAPASVEAAARPGAVDLAWAPVDGAAGYAVWRSLVSGGGFQLVAEAVDSSYVDHDVRNGMRHHYVITALDAAGNPSVRSPEAAALPELALEDLSVGSIAPSPWTLSAVDPGPSVDAVATVDPAGGIPDQFGLRVEAGLGPAGTDPSEAEGWTWAAAEPTQSGEAGSYRAELRPVSAGTFAVATRASTDGGSTWTYGDMDGIANGYSPDAAANLVIERGPDRQAPTAPEGVAVVETTGDHITLRWDPVEAPDLLGYQVLRAANAAGTFQAIGTTSDPVFADTSVEAGVGYAYAVVAEDTSYNQSAPSQPIEVDAARRDVAVTFRVTVPDYTPATDTIHLAGDFQQWDPGATPMTRVDDTTWEFTVPFEDGSIIEYKYTRGSWDAVEKDAGCGEIPNRRLEVTFDDDGGQVVEDIVAKWRDIDQCG
jgi:hypothetical protein